jgi:hypothetical protein
MEADNQMTDEKRIAKDTFLFRDDVDTILYNIEQMTQELVSRGVQV